MAAAVVSQSADSYLGSEASPVADSVDTSFAKLSITKSCNKKIVLYVIQLQKKKKNIKKILSFTKRV